MAEVYRPRIVIAGTNSGVGKTTIVTGLLRCFREQGLQVQSFKIGPDYIDPGFHEKASGRASYNLDTWMTPKERLIPTFATLSHGADISVIEGVMGLYDGGANGVSSTAEIAKILKASVVLVLDCKSAGDSIAATALGFRLYDSEVNIAGVILNKLGSSRHEIIVREAMKRIDMPVLGAFLRNEALQTPERHLGLTPVTEIDTEDLIGTFGEAANRQIDTNQIVTIAKKAEQIVVDEKETDKKDTSVRIAVAKDEAFSFYYPMSLRALEQEGAELIPFSPLHDDVLPEADGVIFGGGFPEMFLDTLENNQSMKDSIRVKAESGIPVYAECGGLMYLSEKISDFNGEMHSMVGLVPGVCEMQPKLQRVGYVTATALCDSIIADAGDMLRGHEFHFSKLHPEKGFSWAYSLQGTRQKEGHEDGYGKLNVLATYLHISFDGNKKAARKFIASCELYSGKKKNKEEPCRKGSF